MTPLIAVAGRTGAPSRVSRDEVAFAGKRYLNSLLRAGGEPVVIAPQQLHEDAARELLQRFDALVLMGGPDVDPSLYGQHASPRVYGVSPQQDAFESALLRAAIANQRPVLAVCRGMQLANVVLGGTLVQHLGDVPNAASLVAHAPGEFPVGAEFVLHDVNLAADCWLANAVKRTTVRGASFHHQGIDRLADGFRAVGHAPDGLLEAIEHDEHRIIGVQWHPEDTSADDVAQQGIYDAFVRTARER
ncbi:MAG: gamma-glutamyl-gamma-aminobutyrate hydrolase family protein [Actinobacteria bacterium]|nr:gamma-glutamyl-gamma-aminobutyrate hydrolase family protein [Actinomycetota bacterium]